MSWYNELKEEIKLKSPNGQEFVALWKNNERTLEKKLGIFDIPNFHGSIVQDLREKSDVYPLNIFFQGPFHNDDAEQFWLALKEVGQWEVVHPVKGPLILQLVSAQEIIAPVDTGNYTEFSTSWLEPANIERIISPDELAVSTLSQIFNTIDDALTQIQEVVTTSYALLQSVKNVFNKTAGFAARFLSLIAQIDQVANETFELLQVEYESAISAFTIDLPDISISAEIIININLAPIQATEDFQTLYSAYLNMIQGIQSESTQNTTTEDDKAKIQAQEFSLTAALIAIAQSIISSTFTNRSEVIAAIENIFSVFNSVVIYLENIQEMFVDHDIDLQYFSQTATYNSLMKLWTLLYQYLLSQFFNLSSEKRFVLKTDRSPLEIVVSEYGSFGENDFNYDLFLTSNQISGDEIQLLRAGREVVIYA